MCDIIKENRIKQGAYPLANIISNSETYYDNEHDDGKQLITQYRVTFNHSMNLAHRPQAFI